VSRGDSKRVLASCPLMEPILTWRPGSDESLVANVREACRGGGSGSDMDDYLTAGRMKL
jgi:hypothetical protein